MLHVPVVGRLVSAACAIKTTSTQSAIATGSLILNFITCLLNNACAAELDHLFKGQAFEPLFAEVAQRTSRESILLRFHRLMRDHFCISGFLGLHEQTFGKSIIEQLT